MCGVSYADADLHGQPVGDDYRVSLLDDSVYYPDGQIKDEVYEYGSFVQSRMFHAGVTCSDCHEPHSLKLRAEGSGVCLQCHAVEKYDSARHHFHKGGRQETQHRRNYGRRHRHVEYQRLSPWPDGWPDAHIDKLAKEGMLFTDYYAEASCTAGRANFITGELPIRTGMTTVGQAGSKIGIPAQAVTIATVLKSMGYATGQFGKNHLGDLNEFLPTVHGFDEFFGYLYHLDAMEDPAHPNYPQNLLNVVGPRNMVHSWAADNDDPTEMPRWGRIGKQRIEDAGPLYPKRMETVDDEIRDLAIKFIDKAQKDGKPFFVWLNPTRMHIVTHLSPKYEATRNSENGWSEEEAGMAQLDDDVGLVMKKLKDIGVDDNTIVVFTTDNGTEVFTWPDGGQTPFAQSKGTVLEGGFRVPAILRWPGYVPADSVQNGIFSGLDWLPTFVAAAGNPNITEELLKGKTIGDRTYRNHLDGYNQMVAITGKGPSARHEIFYLGESTVGAVRIDDYKYRFIDQPNGWLGDKTHPDVPYITNLRLDPFERTGWPNNGTKDGAQQYFDWFKFQFWRFVFVQQLMAKEIKTFLEYPPMQRGASFNLDAVKAEMAKKMAEAEAASKGTGQ